MVGVELAVSVGGLLVEDDGEEVGEPVGLVDGDMVGVELAVSIGELLGVEEGATPVGAIDGVPVGDKDGSEDGLGGSVGDILGLDEGAPAVGCAVVAVGLDEAVTDGTDDRLDDGTNDGTFDGEDEGAEVGSSEGDIEGSTDGVLVGFDVRPTFTSRNAATFARTSLILLAQSLWAVPIAFPL
jgi:hypothetical protein